MQLKWYVFTEDSNNQHRLKMFDEKAAMNTYLSGLGDYQLKKVLIVSGYTIEDRRAN